MLKAESYPISFESKSSAFNERFDISALSPSDALVPARPRFPSIFITLLFDDCDGRLSFYLKDEKVVLIFDDHPSNKLFASLEMNLVK